MDTTPTSDPWRRTAASQAGVISRRQALAVGISDSTLRAKVASGRWQRLHPSIYFTQPTAPLLVQRAWAALLAAGDGAVISHGTAAALHRMLPDRGGRVSVSVPIRRNPRRDSSGIDIYRRRTPLESVGNPRRTPPVATLLDLVRYARDAQDVIGLVTRCAGHPAIEGDALRAAVERQPTLPHRSLLLELSEAISHNVRSALEHRYRRDVELAHGLPTPGRQVRGRGNGRQVIRDLEYEEFRLVIELDGRLNHEASPLAFRDAALDNASVAAGKANLRYGWVAVAGTPCATAAEVALVLRTQGWRGTPSRCGPHCAL